MLDCRDRFIHRGRLAILEVDPALQNFLGSLRMDAEVGHITVSKKEVARFLFKSIAIIFAVVVGIPALCILTWLYSASKERTVSIPINDQLNLNFTIIWNWGMHQRISISRNNKVIAKASQEVFKKPYWSGGPLFTSKDKAHYYVVLRFGAYDIDLTSETITHRCWLDAELVRSLAYLGQFSLKAIPRDSVRGEDVAFTPAGQRPPERSGVSSEDREYKSLCG